jgi:hypothetical protein
MRAGKPVSSPADGTIYLISSGVPNRERPAKLPGFAEKFMTGGPWYQKFDINGNRLVYRAYDMDGKVRDELVIQK